MRKNSASIVTSEQVRNQLISNYLLERKLWIQKLFDPRRDIDAECGHPVELDIKDYLRLYKRGDVAARVVKVWPEESWAERPFIYESEDPEDTEFEAEFKKLDRSFNIIPVLYRADILSGIGRFGIILLGVDDGLSLDQPIPDISENPNGDEDNDQRGPETPRKKRNLLYLRVFDESVVTISKWNENMMSPRFGHPELYRVTFENNRQQDIHWTRVIHIADNRISSDFYGQPRMELVVNRSLDLAKIAGGAAEMFWKGGFPGISLETLPEVISGGSVELDVEATKKQMDAYMNGLQRYIATVGMKANSLSVQIADPTPHVDIQLKLIAIALSIPWRVFVGSESAQLASEQDSRTWNRRLHRRRTDYVTPYIIRPFVQRLVDCQILPRPKQLMIDWPDLNTPSEKDKAVVAEGLSKAMELYLSSGASSVMPPYHFFTLVLGLSEYEARSVIESANSDVDQIEGLDQVAKEQEEDSEDSASSAEI